MFGYFAWKSSSTFSRIGASTAPALQPWSVRSPETLIGSNPDAALPAALSAGPLASGELGAPDSGPALAWRRRAAPPLLHAATASAADRTM